MNAGEDTPETHGLASAEVVVGIDGSDGANLAVRWAARLAAQRGRRLRIVHGYHLDATRLVRNVYNTMSPAVQEGLRRYADGLAEAARRVAEHEEPGLSVAIDVSPGNGADLLIRYSRTAHLVVLGATGMRGPLAHLGSTVVAVASHGHGRVVVVRGTDTDTRREPRPVAVGVDGSAMSEAAIGAAFAEAAERDSELVAVHTWTDLDQLVYVGAGIVVPGGEDESAEEELLAQRLAGWQEKYPDVVVRRTVELSAPAAALTELSKSAQLVVVGSRGRGGFAGLLLGSTSNSLVQHAHCPVMVVHPE